MIIINPDYIRETFFILFNYQKRITSHLQSKGRFNSKLFRLHISLDCIYQLLIDTTNNFNNKYTLIKQFNELHFEHLHLSILPIDYGFFNSDLLGILLDCVIEHPEIDPKEFNAQWSFLLNLISNITINPKLIGEIKDE